jgi:tetratricopeptide (TPR) repeat protein
VSGIFISHTHSDQPIVDAIAQLVATLFGDKVKVNYSSKKELEGGVAPGEDWFQWIVNQVRDSDLALIVLTPASIQKPWVLWEAGAVAGAAFATATGDVRVFPIAFGIRSTDVPSPFARTQVLAGADRADARKLVDEILGRFSFTPGEMVRYGERLAGALDAYIARVSGLLLRLPHLVTEGAIQEWLDRLEELQKHSRFSEVAVIENWLDVAFGRETDDRLRPIDVRIHRRLGELYTSGGRPADAARQFELARQLAPRDIFLLRRLGKAYLDQGALGNARTLLDEIQLLDRTAFEQNAENAALKARWCQQSGDLLGARDVLAAAYRNVPTSYYLGDLLGQVLVELGDRDKAKEIYRQVRRTIDQLHEKNVWAHATALAAAVVCDDAAEATRALDALTSVGPSRGDFDSIERGIGALVRQLGGGTDILDRLRRMEPRT